jgi:NADH:ubiquinone reductase (H+-translocating)
MRRNDSNPTAHIRVLILGGGFGGLHTAHQLERLLHHRRDVEVVLVTSDKDLRLTPARFNRRNGLSPGKGISVSEHCVLRSTHVVKGRATDVDIDRRLATVESAGEVQVIGYDHLVLDLKSVNDQQSIPGGETAFTSKTLTDVAALKDHVLEQLQQADAENDSDRKRRQLTCVVVGNGLDGIDLFSELAGFMSTALRFYPRVRENELRFVLIQQDPRLMSEGDPDLAEYAAALLRSRPGVELRTGVIVKRVEPGQIILDVATIEAETIVLALDSLPSPLFSTLPLTRDWRQRIVVDITLRSAERPEIWALGECAAVPDDNWNAYPCQSRHAIRQAKLMAKNIAAVLAGRSPQPFSNDTFGITASLFPGKGLGKRLTNRMLVLLTRWYKRASKLLTLAGWGRKLRNLADKAAALLTRQDIRKNNLDEKASRSVVPPDPASPNRHNCVNHANSQNQAGQHIRGKAPDLSSRYE